MIELPIVARARSHANAVALRSGPTTHDYQQLIEHSGAIASTLLGDAEDLGESRIAYLVPAGLDHIATQWGIWRSGGIAVPLSLSATEPELEYTLTDAEVQQIVVSQSLANGVVPLCRRLNLPLATVDGCRVAKVKVLPSIPSHRRAMILYTSGTTNRPKGVVTTHHIIQAQIESLIQAWHWQSTDRIPLFLPLHHVHGIINVMSCALWCGAAIEPFAHFEIDTILNRVAAAAYSIFMAVPTIYVKMIHKLQSLSVADRAPFIEGFAAMRLMVSGSAALPASVHQQWTDLTGQRLLERYGMTEIGMALSNPYDGERRAGTVGQPLAGVDLRLKSDKGRLVTAAGEAGEIQVRGPSVFLEYWKRPQTTADAFDDGWFRTGDMAVLEDGYYRIMGRQSVDIIKSGGYKLSALEIEASLLDHPAIRECAVVGVEDDTWGEAVAVATVLQPDQELTLEELRVWCSDRLSKYKIPKRLLTLDALPRNAMGKVTKPAVTALF